MPLVQFTPGATHRIPGAVATSLRHLAGCARVTDARAGGWNMALTLVVRGH